MKKLVFCFQGVDQMMVRNTGSVLTMLELDKRECEVVAMAPNIDQMHVVIITLDRKWMNIEMC